MAVVCVFCIELHTELSLSMIRDSIPIYGFAHFGFFINNSNADTGAARAISNVRSVVLFRTRPTVRLFSRQSRLIRWTTK